MYLKSIGFFLTLCISTNVFASNLFKISPYTLKHTNGRLLLNFQLNEDKKLTIEDGERGNKSFEYKKDQQYQTELVMEECGGVKDLRIVESLNNNIVYNKSFSQPACKDNKKDLDFTFGFISDTQQYTERHESIAKIIAYHNSIDPMQFIINGGDVVQNGQKEEEWISFFNGGQTYLMDIPLIAAIGNHDYRGSKGESLPKFFQKYMRWEGAEANGNLFFELPGFELVVWNSNSSDLTSKQEKEMWEWLENKMVKAKNSNTPLILATHFPVYSSSLNKFTSISVIKLQNILVPLAEKYGVKLILSGHTHMYERSIKGDVNYIVAGPAGGRANKPSFKNKYSVMFDANVLTFTKLKYSNKTLKIDTFNQENVLIDQLVVNL